MTDWTEERPTFELVKRTVTLPEVVEMLGLELDSSDKIRPPWRPDERSPSCHIYTDHFYDYGSGTYGDLFDFVQLIDPDVPLSKVLWLIWNRALGSGKEPGDVQAEPVREIVDFTPELSAHPSWSLPVNDPYGRRADGETMLVPHREGKVTYGVKTRGPDGKRAWPNSMFTHRLYDPWGWASLALFDHIVICEGESDCWALEDALPEARVLALPSGAGAWKDHWLKDLNGYDEIHLCMDNDRAGKSALDKLISKIGHDRAKPLRVPQLFNDAREALEAGWTPQLIRHQ
jgi:hypothetical protein